MAHYGKDYYYLLAVMEMQQGNFDVARTLFQQAVKRSPTRTHAQSDILSSMGMFGSKNGNLQKAKELSWEGIKQSNKLPIIQHYGLWRDKLNTN